MRAVLEVARVQLTRGALPWVAVAVAWAAFGWLLPGGPGAAGALDPAHVAGERRAQLLAVPLAFLAVAALARLARTAGRCRRGEELGLAAAPIAPSRFAPALLLGHAAFVALIALAALAPAAAVDGPRPLGVVATAPAEPRALLGERAASSGRLPPVAARDARVRVALLAIPASGPTASVRLGVRAAGSEGWHVTESRVRERRAVEVAALPTDGAPLEVRLERAELGAQLVVLGDGFELAVPRSASRVALVAIGDAVVGLIAAGALFLALRRALSGGLALAATATPWLAWWLGAPGAALAPAGRLPALLDAVAQGLAPAAPWGAWGFGLAAALLLTLTALRGGYDGAEAER